MVLSRLYCIPWIYNRAPYGRTISGFTCRWDSVCPFQPRSNVNSVDLFCLLNSGNVTLRPTRLASSRAEPRPQTMAQTRPTGREITSCTLGSCFSSRSAHPGRTSSSCEILAPGIICSTDRGMAAWIVRKGWWGSGRVGWVDHTRRKTGETITSANWYS